MKNLYQALMNCLFGVPSRSLSIKDGVEYSLRKYRNTYELLEEYDKKAIQDPEELANAERLRPFIQRLQEEAGVRRANSTI